MFGQNWGSNKWRIQFLVKLHDELCLVACVNKIFVSLRKIQAHTFLIIGLFTLEIFHLSLKHSLLFNKLNGFNVNVLLFLCEGKSIIFLIPAWVPLKELIWKTEDILKVNYFYMKLPFINSLNSQWVFFLGSRRL